MKSPGWPHAALASLATVIGVAGCARSPDADCDFEVGRADAFCVEQRCARPLYRSSTGPASAHFPVDPDIVCGVGDHYPLVEGVDGAENRYDLAVTINPASAPCRPDWRERRNDNDHPSDATHLGAAQACLHLLGTRPTPGPPICEALGALPHAPRHPPWPHLRRQMADAACPPELRNIRSLFSLPKSSLPRIVDFENTRG